MLPSKGLAFYYRTPDTQKSVSETRLLPAKGIRANFISETDIDFNLNDFDLSLIDIISDLLSE